jgi:eukaryotic-like serine/threonine-protein kinase
MEPGAVIAGRFRIEQAVARGGMGTVYRAFDTEQGRHVALKLLIWSLAHGGERFRREAATLASLRHPAIVAYVAHGETEDGRAWLAMEWLDGEPLSARLAREPMPPLEAVRLARRVADALSAAHRVGIVHRDIKPSNLFLPGGEPGAVVVLDFGVARRLVHEDDITEPGVIVGTWSYMAPEQALARADVDARADVFSLGCVLYECVTGTRAFAAGERTAVLAKLLLEDPPRASRLQSAVPEALDDLLVRMLSKDPAGRPRDGLATADALSALGDIDLLPRRMASTQPPGLTDREKRVLSIVLARGIRADDATISETNAPPPEQDLGDLLAGRAAELHFLANGSLLAVVSSRGNPVDGAARAARCALTLRAHRPAAAIAVATGFGVVSKQTPVGVVIDRGVEALRAAEPGTIRLDATSAELLSRRFALELDAEGARLEHELDEIEPSRRLLGKATPFVGRKPELVNLMAGAEQCVEEGRATAVVVTGAAGSGKTRLAHELVARVSCLPLGFEVLFARAESVGAGSPFQLAARLVRHAIADAGSGSPHDGLRRRLEPLLGDPAELERMTAFLGDLIGAPLSANDRPWLAAARADARLMNDALSRAFVDWLGAECGAHPTLLLLDDLHWGDVPSVQLVDAALSRLPNAPLFVLGLARPEVRAAVGVPWAERGRSELALAPLGARSAQRLIRSALGSSAAEATVARIAALSEGNAFYLEELIRAAARGQSEDLPETVLGMVQARLDELDGMARRMLRAASVFGERFTGAGLAALLDADARPKVRAALEDLAHRELLVSRANDEFAFRHALLRDAAYAMLTDADRGLGHRLAGEWLAEREGSDALVIARHFDQGGDPSRAVEWYLRGAERALAGNDYAAALEIATRASECRPEGAALGRARLLEAQALRWMSRSEDALQPATEAAALLEPGSGPWFDARCETGLAAATLARFDACLEAIERIAAQRPAPGVETTRAICVLHVASAALEGVPYARVRELVERAGELGDLRKDGPRVAPWWHSFQALLAHCAGDLSGYVVETERALAAHELLGNERMACLLRMNLGYGLAQLGEFARAEQLLLEAARGADRLGTVRTRAYADHNLGYTLFCAGRLEQARAVQQRAADAAVRLEVPTLRGASEAYLSATYLALGDASAAIEHGEIAVRAAAQRSVLPLAQAALARALLSEGQVARALELARAAVDTFDAGGGLGEEETLTRLAFVEALFAAGEQKPALRALTRARERLLERAARISDPRRRAAHLECIPYHAETLELAARWLG